MFDSSSNQQFADSFQWKYLGHTTATNELTLPEKYDELYVIVSRNTTMHGDCYRFFIPKFALDTNGSDSFQGVVEAQYNSGGGCFLSFQVNLRVINASTIKVSSLAFGKPNTNQDITSYANMWVYYR